MSDLKNTWGELNRKRSEDASLRYTIERGIPIPPRGGRNGAPHNGVVAVIKKLRKGESVLLPIGFHAANAHAWKYIGAGCYVTRKEGAGTRVWRTR